MNERLLAYWESLRKYFVALPPRKKIMWGALSGLLLLSSLAITMVLRHDPQQILYTELHQEDAKAIAKKLSEQNIVYRISEDSRTITVAGSEVYKARMELAKEGLPGQDVVGFEKFDGSTIGMSSYVQRIQYVRAIQGELTRSIQRLAAVKTARVHISIPAKKTFMEEEEPPKASVILELKPGMTPSKTEIIGIANLVASGVEGLKVAQVAIVDTKGNFLHRPGDETAQSMTSSFLELSRSIESEYEKRIEEILTPVVGFGKVRAKVTAEIDPSRVNTTEETYDPDKTVARNTVKTDEVVTGSRPNPVGIPGSRSNLPGTEVQNPGVPMATSSTEKNSTNTNFAIPKKIQITDKPSGSIKRLTVAVVVDGHYAKPQGTGTTETFTPRTEEELKRLQDLVANAVGFDQQRRDSITVSSLPFNITDLIPPEEVVVPWYDMRELSKHGIRNGLVAGVILLFFFLVLRPFLKWSVGDVRKKDLNTTPSTFPQTVAELESAVRAEALPAAAPTAGEVLGALNAGEQMNSINAATQSAMDADGNSNSDFKPLVGPNGELLSPEGIALSGQDKADDKEIENKARREEEELKKKILERLQSTPKKGFRIVQEWLDDQNPKTSEG